MKKIGLPVLAGLVVLSGCGSEAVDVQENLSVQSSAIESLSEQNISQEGISSGQNVGQSSNAQNSSEKVGYSTDILSQTILSSLAESSSEVVIEDPSPYSNSCGTGGSISGNIARVDYDNSWSWVGVPANTTEPLPLIVALHGDEGHPDNMKYFWEPTWRNHNDFIIMAPKCPPSICGESQGKINSWSQGSWNNSDAQANWLIGAIKDIAAKYPVDVSRIYAVGYSGGSLFLGYQGFKKFQSILAGIQWSCGGVNETADQVYRLPEDERCKVPGRLIISRTGDKSYLVTAADRIQEFLQDNGHFNEFFDTKCVGHCCGDAVKTEHQYQWFKKLPPKCGSTIGSGCYEINSIPK